MQLQQNLVLQNIDSEGLDTNAHNTLQIFNKKKF